MQPYIKYKFNDMTPISGTWRLKRQASGVITQTFGYSSPTLELVQRFNSAFCLSVRGMTLDLTCCCLMHSHLDVKWNLGVLIHSRPTHTYGYMLEGRMRIVQCLLHCWPHKGTSLCSCRCGFWLAALQSGDLQTKEPFRMCSTAKDPAVSFTAGCTQKN